MLTYPRERRCGAVRLRQAGTALRQRFPARPGGAEAELPARHGGAGGLGGHRSISSLGNLTGYATDSDTPAGYFIPTDEPFIVWNQRAAIFKAARHPATAKLRCPTWARPSSSPARRPAPR
ncbi:hypothetical protein P4200_00555 [Pseudomonas aeruginosa]|nr:hypothetical protein [Pseudomonas aeruginosa]